MKLVAVLLLISCMFSGCSSDDRLLNDAMDFRKQLLEADSCTFEAVITADYTDVLYTFQMDCTADNTGTLQFTVKDPESISGITGTISQDDSALTFDDKILAFPILADDQLSPVSAPWVFINSLRSGYLSGCGTNDDSLCVYIDDSYAENPLHLEIYFSKDTVPNRVEIIWQNRRVLSMDIRNFTLL